MARYKICDPQCFVMPKLEPRLQRPKGWRLMVVQDIDPKVSKDVKESHYYSRATDSTA